MGNQSRHARAFGLCLALPILLSCAVDGTDWGATQAASDAIRQQIARYAAALNAADVDLASEVWRNAPEVSLIHPAGHAHGWEEVKEFYEFLRTTFSDRKLTVRDVSVHVHGETAWAEFYWRFDARQLGSGAAVQSDGRETQIYAKASGHWRLVHVHYSIPAVIP